MSLLATLYAGMGSSLMASEAMLRAVLHQRIQGQGVHLEVTLSDAASYLALPRTWGLTKPGTAVGGGHVGYGVYNCKDGRMALAALEPHFAARLCAAAGLDDASAQAMYKPAAQKTITAWLRGAGQAVGRKKHSTHTLLI